MRRVLVGIGVALLAVLLPATVVGAQESNYPPSTSVDVQGTQVSRSVDDPGDPGDPGSLALTGSSDSIPMAWVAVGLVVFGGALVFVARQRRSAANRH